MIRVVLPAHLRALAGVPDEIRLASGTTATPAAILDALEASYPVLRGTMRDQGSAKRRDFVRFFACEQDFSLAPPDTPLPREVADGTEPFLVVGAIAGG